ncbi:ABC-2 type transport system permease protein [Paenibacillus phyllosphaerae]|uniref:ABC-2 type transport system permease protein n=1 Tax=Paenibacillus phyllosphaerae TaxID=274593 RepID=A0A7W5B6H8_9BACL|nr:ABC transporter permease [Paenibacillus phyllosphaerae]MBB3114591.1 ABC-2 type transport system permease protein [Paenibacillus phyllosphaerae]
MSQTAMPLHARQTQVKRGIGRWWTEFMILFRIQFAIIRDSWIWVLIMATMFPLTTIMFMRFFTVNPTHDTIIQIIAGNLIFGVIVMGMNGLGQDISWQKHQNHFTFYASLPISKLNFVLANMIRGLMNTLPSFLILGGLGQLIYGVELHLSPGLPLVILLCLSSIVGIGIILGFWSPNHQLTNMLCQALMMLVTFLSPVMVTADQLPQILQWFSYALPTTYAADAMRLVLTVGWTDRVMIDCLVMLVISIISLFVVNRLVSWRVSP